MENEARQDLGVPKVAICCPTGDQVAALFCHDFARMLAHTIRQRPHIDMVHFMITGSLVPKQREALVLEVLESAPDYTHILWLDTDMRFPPDTLLRLLDRGQRIVAANYVERRPPFRPTAFPDLTHSLHRMFSRPEDTGLEAVQAVGFGCVLTVLDVYRKIPRPWFCMGWDKNTQEFVGEDVFFSETARRNGETIWLDHDLSHEIAHIGTMEFTQANAIQYHQAGGNGHAGPVPNLERVLELVKP